MTPGTECPVEMNFLFPERRALCMAENATHNLHNLLTLRGAVVRDAADLVALPQRGHRPVRRRRRRGLRLAPLADLGPRPHRHLPLAAARPLRLPPRPDAAPAQPGLHRDRDRRDDRDAARARGGLAHPRLLRLGQPQREGHLPALPRLVRRQPGAPVAAPARGQRATRYVAAFGGADVVVAKAQGFIDDGDLRFAAELLNHVVFADESNTEARELLAGVYESPRARRRERHVAQLLPPGRLGAPPRRHGGSWSAPRRRATWSGRSPIDQLFDSVAIRINGPRAWDEHLTIDWVFTDLGHTYRLELTNGVLIQHLDPADGSTDLTVTLTKPQLIGLLTGRAGSTASRPRATSGSSNASSPSSRHRRRASPSSPRSRGPGAGGR